ncbi:MAG: alpha/beta hydrolase [Chthoniobacterales bacterium]
MISIERFFSTTLPAFLAALLLSASANTAQAGGAGKEIYGIAPDGTELHWVVYTPSTPGPWPAVLVIHGGGFKTGSPGSGAQASLDLANAGYLAFAIEYRLAPNGALKGQTSDGRYPQQTDDVKMAVRAARSDPRCNGQVGAVGGSAGGAHTAYVAATGTKGDDRIDVGVSLSGAYDFRDFTPDLNLQAFTNDVTNYVNVDISDTADLLTASPINYVDKDVAPLFLIQSEQDPMPTVQITDMAAKLGSLGLDEYQTLTIPGSLHSFDYWSTVKDDVISFLNDRFAGVPFPPQEQKLPGSKLVNVSTRAHVGSGAGVMIGGFIITGSSPKRVAIRGLGPSLAQAGVVGALVDPALEIYDESNHLVAKNDNWTYLPDDIIADGLTPKDSAEAVVAATLAPGSYTAVLSGVGNSEGVALLELYDLDPTHSILSNISTRGQVVSNTDPMIGGFIVNGAEPMKVLVRAIGPSLGAQGVASALADPYLELRNSDGSLLFANDNWRSTQEKQVIDTTIPPTDDHESAIVATLAPGNYTAVVRDSHDGGGIALVEVYALP